MSFASLCFGQTDLGIFRIGEAADGTGLVPKHYRPTFQRVGGRNETILQRLRNQHKSPGDVAGGKNMGHSCL